MPRRPGELGVACAAAMLLAVCAEAFAEDRFGSPARDARLHAGMTVSVAWSLVCGTPESDEMELVLSLDGGITFPIRVSASLPACTSRFDWRVPELPTFGARLGVRKGRKGQPESEHIILVGGPFSILSSSPPDPASAALTPGAIEWWTDQALFDIAAQDLLEQTVGSEPAFHSASEADPCADDPGPEPAPHETLERVRLAAAARIALPPAARPALSRRLAPVPLRM